MLRVPTPYVRWQTTSLILVQTIPLFVLPYFILPLLGDWGLFETDTGEWLADQLFPIGDSGEREYWRSVGFILAWPLFIWNVFTPQPNLLWLAIAFLQTFVLIPWLVRHYGKGVYCGWICSCGALAETLGDAQRAKMPHGPIWNKLNMAGQVILGAVFALLILRITSWLFQGQAIGDVIGALFTQLTFDYTLFGIPLNYSTVVDYFLSGVLALGLYFHFSGRTWCRFFCPLAALMNIYARFTEFRIFAEKEKCISCNVCTTVCHQGIDVMNFANKGKPMEDPQCVRCSACVSSCPTGTLSFGRLRADGTIMLDKLPASPVQIREALAKAE
jgi:polyferredoxin